MKVSPRLSAPVFAVLLTFAVGARAQTAATRPADTRSAWDAAPAGDESVGRGWPNWRGPAQNGSSPETGLPERWEPRDGGVNHLWTYDLAGRGTPVVYRGRLYVQGYRGQRADLSEVLACLDARTGERLWEHAFRDFLSDNAYDRYSIGAPVVDPATGNVFVQTSAGILAGFTADGKMVWRRSLMEEFGRLTFPNGRTGSPVVEGDLVLTRGITSNWGAQGAGGDRFYAFDTATGRPVWASTPGELPPKDNSFSTPVLDTLGEKRVFYAGTGDGSLVCVNARTGEPIWRYKASAGGVNASVVLVNGKLIGGHADENPDTSEPGRIVAINLAAAERAVARAATRPATQPATGSAPASQPDTGPGGSDGRGHLSGHAGADGAITRPAPSVGSSTGVPATPSGGVALDRSAEAWRLDALVLTSSPVVAGGRVYQVTKTGDLLCLDPDAGKVLWREKLGQDQLHASPVFADGKLYVPLWHEGLFILRPGEKGAETLAKIPLEGEVLGAPAVADGRVYLLTTARLYCFGDKDRPAATPTIKRIPFTGFPGPATQLQIVPSEVLLRPGQKVAFEVRGLDAQGRDTGQRYDRVSWRKFVPPTALVKSEMDAAFNDAGELVAGPDAKLSAGQFEAMADGVKGPLRGYVRGRVLPALPYAEDFERFELTEPPKTEKGVRFAYPPLPWIGARFKFEVRELEGSKVLAKTLDNVFFQRALVFIGTPDMKDYTIEADVRSEGTRRGRSVVMSGVGVINQRYIISLVGASQQIEVQSNHDRLKVAAPFASKPDTWYRLKSRVDVGPDGAGVIRAKAWPRGEPEPEAWTLEVPHAHAHAEGSPGLYGFSPNAQFRVFIDNVRVTPNGSGHE